MHHQQLLTQYFCNLELLSSQNNNSRGRSRVDANKKPGSDEKEKDKKNEKENKLLKSIVKPIFSLKNISISYTESNGTFLPGFLPNTCLLYTSPSPRD